MNKMKPTKTLIAIIFAVLPFPSLSAATVAMGTNPDLDLPGAWDNGLPSPGNNGSIGIDSNLNNFTSGAGTGTTTVTHSAGTITTNGSVGDGAWRAGAGTTLNWNQTGGTVVGPRQFFVTTGVNYTLDGGTIDFGALDAGSSAGGSRLIIQGTGTFTFLSGTMRDGGYDAQNGTSSISLLGGTNLNIINAGITSRLVTNLITIGGDFTIDNALSLTNNYFNGAGIIRFNTDWTGSLGARALNWDRNAWLGQIGSVNVQVGNTQVTAGNFDSFFAVQAGTGRLSLIPEPSSLLLGSLGALFLLRRKR